MLKKGIYRNHKGKLYQVLGTAIDTETREEMVVYTHLYDDPEFPPFESWWVRSRVMFEEMVEKDGKKIPRFEYVGDQGYKKD